MTELPLRDQAGNVLLDVRPIARYGRPDSWPSPVASANAVHGYPSAEHDYADARLAGNPGVTHIQVAMFCVRVDTSRAPVAVRLILLGALCWVWAAEIADPLVDLLIGLIHKINTRVDRRVDRELTEDLRRVRGREGTSAGAHVPRSSYSNHPNLGVGHIQNYLVGYLGYGLALFRGQGRGSAR